MRKPVEKCDGVHIFEANEPNYRLSDAKAQILSGAVSSPPGHRLDQTLPPSPHTQARAAILDRHPPHYWTDFHRINL